MTAADLRESGAASCGGVASKREAARAPKAIIRMPAAVKHMNPRRPDCSKLQERVLQELDDVLQMRRHPQCCLTMRTTTCDKHCNSYMHT